MNFKSIPKSTQLLLLSTFLLSVITVIVLQKNNLKNTLDTEDSMFALSDSGSVTKIELAYQTEKLVLELLNDKTWQVNGLYQADADQINQIIKFLSKVEVKRSVYKEESLQVNDALEKNSYQLTLSDENGTLKKYYLTKNEADYTTLFAKMDGFQTSYLLQMPGFDGNLGSFLNTNALEWKNRVLFDSKIRDIEQIKISFYQNLSDGYTILRDKNRFLIKEVDKADSLRLYSFLQLFEKVKVAAFLPPTFQQQKDSLSKIEPTFGIELKDIRQAKWNQIQIFYQPNQKTKIFAFVGANKELVVIKPSIFEYILQKRSFFEKKSDKISR
jgi:hypothetical protein